MNRRDLIRACFLAMVAPAVPMLSAGVEASKDVKAEIIAYYIEQLRELGRRQVADCVARQERWRTDPEYRRRIMIRLPDRPQVGLA